MPWDERARAAADVLGGSDHVTVVHHIDADGVAAGAVATDALRRAGLPFTSIAVRSMDQDHQDLVARKRSGTLWFCDLGSTVYDRFDGPMVVCDHHELVRSDDGSEEFPGHVNPLLDGLPGDGISGAGCAYLVAEAMGGMEHLRPLALVGATADLQDRATGRLHGTNQELLDAAVAAGQVRVTRDFAWFGIATRSIDKFLGLARDPAVPGLQGDRGAVPRLLGELQIDQDAPTWMHLDDEQRLRLRSAIVNRFLDVGSPAEDLQRLWRDIILFPDEPLGEPTCEAQAFATLLNATARYDRPEIGLAVAAGDRDQAYSEATDLLGGHRRHLVQGLDAFARHPLIEGDAVQWIDLEGDVRDTVVGILCGMAFDALGLRRDKVLVGFAKAPGGVKVSSRAPAGVGDVDLAYAMRQAAEAVGGTGGGHKRAAGATIPEGAQGPFIAHVDAILVAAGQSRPGIGQQTLG